ncbi:unnamed protein product, partial [Urochloa humidicola]
RKGPSSAAAEGKSPRERERREVARGRWPAEARREVRRETVAGDGAMGSGAEVDAAAVAASKSARARRGSRSARTRRWRWSEVRVFGHLFGMGLAGGIEPEREDAWTQQSWGRPGGEDELAADVVSS